MSGGSVHILDNFEQDRTITQNIRVFSMAAFNAYTPEWPRLMPKVETDMPYEKQMHYEGSAAASVRTETDAQNIRKEMKEGYLFTVNLKHYAAEMAIGMHQRKFARKDHKFLKQIADFNVRSINIAQEYEGANVLNNGFDTNYVGGDSAALFSSSHAWQTGGTYDNTLAAAAASKTSLETAYTTIAAAKMEQAIPAKLMVKKIIFGTSNYFVIPEIYSSQYNPETNTNAKNMLESEGAEMVLNHYLTDTDSYYLHTQEDSSAMYQAGAPTPDSYLETTSTRYQIEAINLFCGASFFKPLAVFGSQGLS